jgi:predicted membrane-bound mannosyltransferase
MSDFLARPVSLTLEQGAWMFLVFAAVVTRFWNLGYRTLHHDESLHTYYSYMFSTGDVPYVHDPLMHGPFLFFGNAIVYLLFGASDATSRYLPALFGVILVWMPWLLRGNRFLGRWGALAASFMFLISPSFLYYTRYIRHDPYTVVGALLLAIAIFRYLERPQRRWIIISAGSIAFLIANHEIVFAIIFVFLIVLWGALLVGRFRPLIPVHLAAAGLAVMLVVVSRLANWRDFPAIPWENASDAETARFYEHFFLHPLVLGLTILGIGFIASCVWIMRGTVPTADVAARGYMESIFADAPPNSMDRGLLNLWRDRVGLGYGLILAVAILVVLFTTVFTNMHGLETMTYAPDGTLLYWLGQQNVRRGSQPWYYFFTEATQYEWLAIFFGVTAGFVVLVRLIRATRGGHPGPNLLFNTFMACWFGGIFVGLSYAGEKMPWLIVHFTLPAIILGAALVNELVDGAVHWYRRRGTDIPGTSRIATRLLVIGIVLGAAGWFFLMSRLTAGNLVASVGQLPTRSITAATLDVWWTLALVPLAILVAVAGFIAWVGPRRTAYSVIVAMVLLASVFQVHAGFRLAYLDGDVAKDTLIYNTTSPDVKAMTEELGQMSELLYGDRSMAIGFDGCVQWPMLWYFRDFDNASRISNVDTASTLPPVIVGVPSMYDSGCTMPDQIDGYTAQALVLRWHEPEYSIYRNFAIAPELLPRQSIWGDQANPHGITAVIGSIIDSFWTQTDPEGQQRLFRLVMFREMPTGLNPYRYKIYVRNDMLPYYNQVRYGD